MRSVAGDIIPIYEFCHGTGVNYRMEGNETGQRNKSKFKFLLQGEAEVSPSRTFWDINTQENLSPFSQCRAFGDEPQTVKVHVRAADNGDKFLLGANEVVINDVSLQSS